MTKSLRLDFDDLPLVEAAVRASFNGPKDLTFSLVNSIHADLKPSFPALTESQQHEIAPGAGEQEVKIGPGYLPGAIYTGHASGLSVHVHPQVIVARWSKRPGPIELKYPRYAALRESLWKTVETFRRACGDDFPGIAVVNMSYVNFIPTSDPASVVKTYFSQAAQMRALDNAREVRKLEAAWCEGNELDVRFSLEQAAAKLPDGLKPGFRLTTAAGLRLGESVDAKSGLENVHDVLQEFFLKLISQQARDEWKLRENKNG